MNQKGTVLVNLVVTSQCMFFDPNLSRWVGRTHMPSSKPKLCVGLSIARGLSRLLVAKRRTFLQSRQGFFNFCSGFLQVRSNYVFRTAQVVEVDRYSVSKPAHRIFPSPINVMWKCDFRGLCSKTAGFR